MQLLVRKQQPMTVAEFDDFVERQGDDASLYELIGGVVFMMTNPTRRHGKIVANIGWHLKGAMDKRGCETFIGDVRIQRDEDIRGLDKPKPDLLVRCGRSDASRDRLNYVTDPVVVVEALSPSTMDVDRGPKLDFYKSLPSLQHIVIAYQDQVRIEHYRREGERWTMDALTKPEAALGLAAVDFTMTVAEAYFDVSLG